jgi:UDP-N-acetylmuramoyl-tripeptide--D-alanyl-D-alanine ligase
MAFNKLKSGAIIIDDSYNSNPVAAREALSVFSEISKGKNKIVVFGDMLELGRGARQAHKNIGEFIAKLGLSRLICIGPLSAAVAEEVRKSIGERAVTVKNSREAVKSLRPFLRKNTMVFIKGSRSIGLEKVVSGLRRS